MKNGGVYKIDMASIELRARQPFPEPKIPPPTTEEIVKRLNEAQYAPWLVKWQKEHNIELLKASRKDIVLGGPGCGMCNEGPLASRS